MALRVNQLLHDIQQAVGCRYISDLRQPNHTELSELIKKAILDIPDETYTIEEWAQVISYLKGKCEADASVEEMKSLF